MSRLNKAVAIALYHAARFVARGYDSAEENYNRGNLPWDRRASQDEDRFVSGTDRETIRQKLLDKRRNDPLVKGTCDRMCDFVVGPDGLVCQAQTESEDWNTQAEDYWADWCRRCDVTGRWPFRKIQRAFVDARLWAGESFALFLADGRLQGIEAERVRQPQGVVETATRYDGMQLAGPVVRAWYIADRDDHGTFSQPAGRWVPASNVYHFGSPWRFDSIRALPELAAGYNVITDIGEISLFTLMQMKKQAMIAGISNTEGGTDLFGTRNSAGKGRTAEGIRTQKLDSGGVILRALMGEKIELAQPATPNPNLEGHLVFNLRKFCASAGIPYEVTLMDATRGNLSQNKAVRELFSRVVETWQLDLADFVRFVWAWQIAFAIRTNQIAPAPVSGGRSQWDRVRILPPPATWADPQDAAETDAKNLVLGKTTHDAVTRRGGLALKDVWTQRAKEEQLRQALASEYKVDPDKIANVQVTGNASASGASATGAGEKGSNETGK